MATPDRFDGLTLAQSDAFARIATGLPARASKRTLALLESRGLIEPHEVFFGRDALGPITVIEYEVPLRHHIRWCAWCAARLGELEAAPSLSGQTENPE